MDILENPDRSRIGRAFLKARSDCQARWRSPRTAVVAADMTHAQLGNDRMQLPFELLGIAERQERDPPLEDLSMPTRQVEGRIEESVINQAHIARRWTAGLLERWMPREGSQSRSSP